MIFENTARNLRHKRYKAPTMEPPTQFSGTEYPYRVPSGSFDLLCLKFLIA